MVTVAHWQSDQPTIQTCVLYYKIQSPSFELSNTHGDGTVQRYFTILCSEANTSILISSKQSNIAALIKINTIIKHKIYISMQPLNADKKERTGTPP